MTVDRYLRLVAGTFVMASVALGYYVHPGFFYFTAFVGLNLFQSAFSNWCPLITILRKLGVPDTAPGSQAQSSRPIVKTQSHA